MYHIYGIRVQNRDALISALAEKDIFCGIHYPVPVHLQDAYASLMLAEGSFPVAEKCAKEYVSLPMFSELTKDQIDTVVKRMIEAFSRLPMKSEALDANT